MFLGKWVENLDFQQFHDLQVMEFVKLFDPPGHARVTMTKSPQDYLKAGDVTGCVKCRHVLKLRNIRKAGKKDVQIYDC